MLPFRRHRDTSVVKLLADTDWNLLLLGPETSLIKPGQESLVLLLLRRRLRYLQSIFPRREGRVMIELLAGGLVDVILGMEVMVRGLLMLAGHPFTINRPPASFGGRPKLTQRSGAFWDLFCRHN